MRKDLLIIALGLFFANGAATADVLATPEADPAMAVAAKPTLPAKGITMAVVEKKFGAPVHKRATVGGDTPKHPPITRWDYDGFSVIFENDRVVDAVIPGAPPRVYHKDQLTPVASSAAPMPPPASPMVEPPPAAEPIVPEPAAETIPEAPAEAAAAPPPAEEPAAAEPPAAEPSSPTPAQMAPAGTYPDRPPSETPAEEAPPQDAPPTPK